MDAYHPFPWRLLAIALSYGPWLQYKHLHGGTAMTSAWADAHIFYYRDTSRHNRKMIYSQYHPVVVQYLPKFMVLEGFCTYFIILAYQWVTIYLVVEYAQ